MLLFLSFNLVFLTHFSMDFIARSAFCKEMYGGILRFWYYGNIFFRFFSGIGSFLIQHDIIPIPKPEIVTECFQESQYIWYELNWIFTEVIKSIVVIQLRTRNANLINILHALEGSKVIICNYLQKLCEKLFAQVWIHNNNVWQA